MTIKKGFSEEQIIGILKEQEGGMDVSEPGTLKALEVKSPRLRGWWPTFIWISRS